MTAHRISQHLVLLNSSETTPGAFNSKVHKLGHVIPVGLCDSALGYVISCYLYGGWYLPDIIISWISNAFGIQGGVNISNAF